MHEACAACALHHQEVENGGKCNAAQRAAQPPVNFLVAESKQQSKEVLQDKPRKKCNDYGCQNAHNHCQRLARIDV